MTDKQFQSELFQNYEKMREHGRMLGAHPYTGKPYPQEAALLHLPKLKKGEVVAHFKQMHGFLEEPYIFGDISNGDRGECWGKWCKKLAKDGVDDPYQFAYGLFYAVDATAAYT